MHDCRNAAEVEVFSYILERRLRARLRLFKPPGCPLCIFIYSGFPSKIKLFVAFMKKHNDIQALPHKENGGITCALHPYTDLVTFPYGPRIFQ